MPRFHALPLLSVLFAGLAFACANDGNGGDGSEADQVGVGAACAVDEDCPATDGDTDGTELVCLPQFSGGYCGLEGCTSNEDCPDASACVRHTDGVNYCFRQCLDKSECNVNRPEEVWSNCSSNIEFVNPNTSSKACVPPSAG